MVNFHFIQPLQALTPFFVAEPPSEEIATTPTATSDNSEQFHTFFLFFQPFQA